MVIRWDSIALGYVRIGASSLLGRVEGRLDYMKAVVKKLEFVDELSPFEPTSRSEIQPRSGQSVFLVHGSDVAANEQVTRFIEAQPTLKLVRLSEQPHLGQTLMEKLESHSNVDFAIALMTDDDRGASKGKANRREEWEHRARQNVIFELGYFVGKIGREKVCVLFKPSVNPPSDYKGVGYHEMDSGGGWKMKLGKEMEKVGMRIDFSKIARITWLRNKMRTITAFSDGPPFTLS